MISISWKEETNMRCISHSGVSRTHSHGWRFSEIDMISYVNICASSILAGLLCVWNIWRDVKLLTVLWFFDFLILHNKLTSSRGTIHVLCAMVQRRGHSTCGYHGWSPWRTCFIFRCQCSEMATGQAKNRHVDLIYILFMPALLSQSGIFYGQ